MFPCYYDPNLEPKESKEIESKEIQPNEIQIEIAKGLRLSRLRDAQKRWAKPKLDSF